MTIMETIEIKLPKTFMNVAVTTCNHLTADTNDSANWDTLKFPLPEGKWSIYSMKDGVVMLSKTSKRRWRKC